MNCKLAWLASVTAVLGSVALADNKVIYVNVDSVDILDAEGATASVIKSEPMGTPLTVLNQDGSWYKVQASDAQGFLYAASISPDKPNLNLLSGVGGAGQVDAASAAKGLQPETIDYAKSNNLSPDLLNQYVNFRKTITMADFQAFATAGNVGLTKPAK